MAALRRALAVFGAAALLAACAPAAAGPVELLARQAPTATRLPAAPSAQSTRAPVAHGAHLAWDDGIGAAEYNALLGRNATIFGDFFDVGSSPLRDQKYNFSFCEERMMRHAKQVLNLGYGAAYSIAVMPWEGLQYWGTSNCSSGTYIYKNCTKQGQAGDCNDIVLNCTMGDPMYPGGYTEPFLKLIDELVDLGLPIIIRWGHEMNGNWYPWGDQQDLFVRIWREFVDAMRPATRAAVKMEWAPNAVPDCEWRPADYDPYLPFWPGDDYVDIVGMSIYFYGTEDHTINEIVPDNTLWNWLDGVNKYGNFPICNHYRRLAVGRDKPFFFSETAAAWHVGKTGPTAIEIKQSWWRQLYNESTFDRYNLTRAIVWFEIRKEEWGDDRDFRLVIGQGKNESGIMDAWLDEIPTNRMAFGGGESTWCDRTWWLDMFNTGPNRLPNGTGDLGAACPPRYRATPTVTGGVVSPTASATLTVVAPTSRPSSAGVLAAGWLAAVLAVVASFLVGA
ncbi:glycoside hydrolase superfamily [Hyaloraphidium curvatum]|nr:glycoside hydrolase superfamily [Hyaloraphidium curvatum]